MARYAVVAVTAQENIPTLPGYDVTRRIGGGGMGEVFEAVDRSLGRVVAIKRLRSDRLDPNLPGWKAWNARFRREARLLAAINHPNIATIHAIVEHGGVLHLVMEHVDGHSLRDVLRSGPLEVELALEVARQVATGLMAAHEAGVIHRDVKPDNIRINSKSVVKILDFGLAREREEGEDSFARSPGTGSPTDAHTVIGAFVGTPGYASPEQVMGETVDQRTDVFGFGCVLFEMLCGQRPFDARGRHGARVVLEEDAPWALLPAGVPAGLENLLRELLSRDRLGRPSGLTEVLPRLTKEPPASAGPPSDRSANAIANNLPREHSSFVGRQREVREVLGLMSRSRLVTLTGIGGTGKSRLALRVGEVLCEHDGGRSGGGVGPGDVAAVHFIPVEPGSKIGRLVGALARACGCREAPGTPLIDHVVERFGVVRGWVILDGCEHAPDAARALVNVLLDRAPGIGLLCTAREGLDLPGEALYRVPMLPTQPAGEPPGRSGHAPGVSHGSGSGHVRSDALALFLDRAGLALAAGGAQTPSDDDLSRAAAICRRLGGMPLAIEIAAGFVEAASLEDLESRIAAGLDVLNTPLDADPQQRTIDSVLQWSIDRLDARQGAVLRRMTVFSGEFSLAAAEAVGADAVGPSGDGVAARHVLAALLALVRRGLVVRSTAARSGVLAWAAPAGTPTTRYRLLDPVRQYVGRAIKGDPLHSSDALMARARHGAYYLSLVEDLSPRLDGPQQAACMGALGDDHQEILAAMDAMNDPERLLRLAVGMARFWYKTGFPSVGRRRLEAAMQKAAPGPADAKPTLLHIRAESFLGVLQWSEGRFDEAERHYRRALSMAKQSEEHVQVAAICGNIGLLLMQQGNLSGADASLTDAIRASELAGDPMLVDRVRLHIGGLRVRMGAWAEARELLGRCLNAFRAAGDRTRAARALSKLGEVDRCEGRLADAWAKGAEAAEMALESGDRPALTEIVEQCAVTAWRLGERERAGRLVSITGRIRREDGSHPGPEISAEIAEIESCSSESPESAMDGSADIDTLDAIRQGIKAIRGR